MRRAVVAPFDGRTVRFTHTFTSPAWREPRVSSSTLRFIEAPALLALLAEAGLAAQSVFGDFDGGPLDAASPEIVVIAGLA